MPVETRRLPLTGSYSAKEFELLSRGLVPDCMEDKWFIYLEGDALNFHRSWTGVCVYRVRVQREADRYRMVEARVNAALASGIGAKLQYQARVLRFLIEALLLGKPHPFPLPHGISDSDGILQHAWTGTGCPTDPPRDEALTSRFASGWIRGWRRVCDLLNALSRAT